MADIIIPVLTLAFGVFLGHWTGMKRDSNRVVVERRAEYATEFMAQAYHNLRYFVEPVRLGGESQPMGDFTVMGRRAAF